MGDLYTVAKKQDSAQIVKGAPGPLFPPERESDCHLDFFVCKEKEKTSVCATMPFVHFLIRRFRQPKEAIHGPFLHRISA